MIEVPTVLILGAGASKPYGFPLGIELKDNIISNLGKMADNNSGWASEPKFDEDLVFLFIDKFAMSTRSSIDSFLAYHEDDFKEIGKIAIVDAISKCENDNKLHPGDDDWYTYLANFIYECPFEEIGNNKIGIITYNYDRSLESFLYYSLLASYKEGSYPEECVLKLNEIPIVHMYGRLDPLPWESKDGRPYGKSCSRDKLFEMSNDIRLIQEATKEEIPTQANALIKNAKKVYFLGLDLRRRENLELLDLSLLRGKQVLSTAYDLKHGERNNISSYLTTKTENATFIHVSGEYMKSLEAIKTYMPFE